MKTRMSCSTSIVYIMQVFPGRRSSIKLGLFVRVSLATW